MSRYDDHAEMRVQPDPLDGDGRHHRGAITVLIVESDRPTLRTIRRALESDGRFGTVSAVATGDDAVDRSVDVDVVVVDLCFVHGLGALGTISRIARLAGHPRILGLSRRGEDWLTLAARCEGADDVLDWPEDQGGLVERLTRATQPA